MKKLCTFAAMISVLFFVVPVHAQYVEEVGFGVDLEQIFGVNASFNADSNTITWAGGANGWLLLDTGDPVFFSDLDDFNSSPVNATFTVMDDLSSGGQAKARFASGTWDISIIAEGYANPVAYLAGSIVGNYNETETDVTSDALNGRAVVVVEIATFDDAYWTSALGLDEGETIGWKGVGQLAGIIADISLPYGQNIQNYSQNYHSDDDNVVVTLYADEGVIPEPATIALIALGGLLLRKRG
jgi:hypothetical protein